MLECGYSRYHSVARRGKGSRDIQFSVEFHPPGLECMIAPEQVQPAPARGAPLLVRHVSAHSTSCRSVTEKWTAKPGSCPTLSLVRFVNRDGLRRGSINRSRVRKNTAN